MSAGAALAIAMLAAACGPKPRVEPEDKDARVEPIDAAVPSDGPAVQVDAAVDGRLDGGGAGGLDPDLDVPPASNQVCTMPGSLTECPGVQVCRFFSPTEGRCESCAVCGNLNAACTASDQCDILFMCFQGRCTNFCTLGTTECGSPQDCIDIGHPTRGVCRP